MSKRSSGDRDQVRNRSKADSQARGRRGKRRPRAHSVEKEPERHSRGRLAWCKRNSAKRRLKRFAWGYWPLARISEEKRMVKVVPGNAGNPAGPDPSRRQGRARSGAQGRQRECCGTIRAVPPGPTKWDRASRRCCGPPAITASSSTRMNSGLRAQVRFPLPPISRSGRRTPACGRAPFASAGHTCCASRRPDRSSCC